MCDGVSASWYVYFCGGCIMICICCEGMHHDMYIFVTGCSMICMCLSQCECIMICICRDGVMFVRVYVYVFSHTCMCACMYFVWMHNEDKGTATNYNIKASMLARYEQGIITYLWQVIGLFSLHIESNACTDHTSCTFYLLDCTNT